MSEQEISIKPDKEPYNAISRNDFLTRVRDSGGKEIRAIPSSRFIDESSIEGTDPHRGPIGHLEQVVTYRADTSSGIIQFEDVLHRSWGGKDNFNKKHFGAIPTNNELSTIVTIRNDLHRMTEEVPGIKLIDPIESIDVEHREYYEGVIKSGGIQPHPGK